MAEDKNPESGFRVIDRRSFTADGTRRQVDNPERAEQARKPEPPPRPAPPREPQADFGEGFEEPAAEFETLVSYLTTTALFQLGVLTAPSGERIPPDLANAQRTIDLLEVLQQKTRGNLTPEETNLLDGALYELRLRFVEVQGARPNKAR